MSESPHDADARALFAQHAARVRFEPAPPPSATTLRAAYEVQRRYVALLVPQKHQMARHWRFRILSRQILSQTGRLSWYGLREMHVVHVGQPRRLRRLNLLGVHSGKEEN